MDYSKMVDLSREEVIEEYGMLFEALLMVAREVDDDSRLNGLAWLFENRMDVNSVVSVFSKEMFNKVVDGLISNGL